MSATALILVVATVVSVQAGTASLDRGRQDGLETGDQGQIYYQLTVAGQPKRIEVGPAEIQTAEASTATVTTPNDLTIRAGYRFEVQIPNDRLLSSMRPASVPAGVGGAETTPPNMILIPAGRHAIGLDLANAEFFSQTPQFTIDLPPFWIDRHPTTQRSLTYPQAQAHCRDQGKRLPTEIEWEIATQQSEVTTRPGLLEWAASWYQPYPGNTRPEPQFGQHYRVLRGSTSATTPDPHARRYLAPGDSNLDVGFRCARDQP